MVRRIAGGLVWVVALFVLLAPCGASASPSIVVSSADFSTLGLRSVPTSVGEARAQLLARLPSHLGRRLDETVSQASAAETRGLQVRSDAFVLGSASVAERVLGAWRTVHRGGRVAIGAGGAVSVTGSRVRVVAQLLWRDGARLGLVVLSAPRDPSSARATAISYAQLAESDLPTPLPRTAWDKVLAQIRPNGTVSEATALEAFALSYGPLPGVRIPSGPRTAIESGDLAADWVLPHLPGLPRRLRQVIDRDLGLTPPGAQGHAASFGDSGFTPNPKLTADANHWADVYAGPLLLGHTLTKLTIVAGYTTTHLGKDPLKPPAADDTLPVNAAGQESATGPFCRIRVGPDAAPINTVSGQHQLAHEVFHCEQDDLFAGATHLPAWITEGLAEWAAQTVIPAPAYEYMLRDYVNSPHTDLFARTYDAEGFWGHVQDTVVGDLWQKVSGILDAPNEDAAYVAAGGMTERFRSTWGSSVFNLTAGGSPWEMTSPILRPAQAQPDILMDGGGQVLATPYTTAQYTVKSSAAKPLLHVTIAGDAVVSDARLGAQPQYNYTRLSGASKAWFCTSGTGKCVCPAGDTSEIPPNDPLSSDAELGLSGDPNTGTHGELVAYELSAFCRPPVCPAGKAFMTAQDDGGAGCGIPVPGLQDGDASTGGDPHVLDFDGGFFDFQDAGEFTLLKSTQDKLAIQVRQQPFPGSDSVAVNAAVAMRVGSATVEVDSSGVNAINVYVNKVRTQASSVNLGGGGRLTVHGFEATVRWPDGSNAYVVSAETSPTTIFAPALDVTVTLARHRQGHVEGVLGNWGGSASAEFVGGNGHHYSQVEILNDVPGVVYGQFGASWRITQRESLFRYPPGKSTSSYDVRGFPGAQVTTATLPPGELAAGEAACNAAGITNAHVFDDCEVDVGATGDTGFAGGDRRLQTLLGIQATPAPTPGQVFNVTIPGTADIFGAGQAQPPALTGNPGPGTGGGTLPPQVSFAAAAGEVLTVPSVTGAVYCDTTMLLTATPNGPCASNSSGTALDPVGPISGIVDSDSNDFLTGVFLGNAQPTGAPPASLDFSSAANGADYTMLSPRLGQTFFVGNGRTSSGALHQIIVPAGATRLFLGIADGSYFEGDPGYYDDDGGAYQASVDLGASTAETAHHRSRGDGSRARVS